MKYIKYISLITTLSVVALFSGGVALAAPSTFAVDTQAKQDACAGLSQLDSSQNCTTQGSSVENLVREVVELIAIIIGVVSVIVIMFSGFRYITSGGDTNATNSARNMLIYAIVGLLIAFLAQFLASNVLNTANNVKTGNTSGYLEVREDHTG
jgi:Type IV secretion system pilin